MEIASVHKMTPANCSNNKQQQPLVVRMRGVMAAPGHVLNHLAISSLFV